MVGLPNVGKNTLFNALTNAGAESANYPFCTIEKNVGIVSVPDERLDKLAEMYEPDKFTPATLEFVDIAGLVKGASKGEGLGNKFLADIREVALSSTLYAASRTATSSTSTAASIPSVTSRLSTSSSFSQISKWSTDVSTAL